MKALYSVFLLFLACGGGGNSTGPAPHSNQTPFPMPKGGSNGPPEPLKEVTPQQTTAPMTSEAVEAPGPLKGDTMASAPSPVRLRRPLGLISASQVLSTVAPTIPDCSVGPTIGFATESVDSVKWGTATCRDGEVCYPWEHVPFCDKTLVGPLTTGLPCTPYELGRVRVTSWKWLNDADVQINLDSTCHPGEVMVRSFWTVPRDDVNDIAQVKWTFKQGVQASTTIQLHLVERCPCKIYVEWFSQNKRMYDYGCISRPWEISCDTNELLNKLGTTMRWMAGPFLDYRPGIQSTGRVGWEIMDIAP